jgi:predicted Zn-dependent protease
MIGHDQFEDLARAALADLPEPDEERISLSMGAEHSHFLRFNHALVRQATDVAQAQLTLTRTRGLRSAASTLTLSGDRAEDLTRIRQAAEALADDLPHLPDDPHTLLPDTVASTFSDDSNDSTGRGGASWPDAAEVVRSVARSADGRDVVGLYAAGPQTRAFADNRGQRNWHRSSSFALDWSHVLHTDQAVKSVLAGPITAGGWGDVQARLHQRMADAAKQMQLLKRPARSLKPGRYRAWLAPSAVAELMSTLAWGAFGLKEQRTGTSPFNRLLQGERLSPLVDLSETIAPGLAPAFTPQGFVRPDSVALVQQGHLVASLVSPRTAQEFGHSAQPLSPNSHNGESPECLHLGAGRLAEADALSELGTGLFISNLHYLNYSDRLQGRITGMTRYACFWVEDGQLVAPLPVMRFDQDVIRLLGDDLIALGDQAEWLPDLQTYGARSVGGVRAPGALVAGLNLVL